MGTNPTNVHLVKELVMKSARDAGCILLNHSSDEEHALYFDVQLAGEDVGCISRGWTDPGYRLLERVDLPIFATKIWMVRLREFCATNGISLTRSADDPDTTVLLESVVYEEGFNAATLAKSLEALRDCKRELLAVTNLATTELLLGGMNLAAHHGNAMH